VTEPSKLTRKHLHSRDIRCRGFERSDGLWEVEAELLDAKSSSSLYTNHERGVVPAGEPVHNMLLCITIDIELVIQEVYAEMLDTPYMLCKSASDIMSDLVGLKIGPGWIREARKRIGPTQSCTHLMELLRPLASTAYQTMHSVIDENEKTKSNRSDPMILDQCKTLSRDSAVVKVMWPEFYVGKD
jgi:hypothetical protein